MRFFNNNSISIPTDMTKRMLFIIFFIFLCFSLSVFGDGGTNSSNSDLNELDKILKEMKDPSHIKKMEDVKAWLNELISQANINKNGEVISTTWSEQSYKINLCIEKRRPVFSNFDQVWCECRAKIFQQDSRSFMNSDVNCREEFVLNDRCVDDGLANTLDFVDEPLRRTDRGYDINGCTLPPAFFYLPSIPQTYDFHGRNQPFISRAGLGATAFGKDQGHAPTRDDVLKLPCNQHDLCYDTCGISKGQCDDQFELALFKLCRNAYPTEECPHKNSPMTCGDYASEREKCFNWATVYTEGVIHLGLEAYNTAQDKRCGKQCIKGGVEFKKNTRNRPIILY